MIRSAPVNMGSVRIIQLLSSHLLVQVVHDWAKALDSCSSSNCLFLNFAKAFDSFPHQCLLSVY